MNPMRSEGKEFLVPHFPVLAIFIFCQYISLFDQCQLFNYEAMHQTMRQAKRTPCDDRQVDFVQFSVLSHEQILNYSVLQIHSDHFYENDNPARGGLFDLRLGISGPKQVCQTCGESNQCPGHFGHIKLTEPVLHYGFLEVVAQILKCICHRCFRVKRGEGKQVSKNIKEAKRIANPFKRLAQMSKLLGNIKKCSKQLEEEDLFDRNFACCNSWIPTKIGIKNYKITYFDDNNRQKTYERRQIKAALQGLSAYDNQCEALGFTKTKPIDLLIQTLAVCPPQVRPYILIDHETKFQDDLSRAYLKVLQLNKKLKTPTLTLIQKGELIDEMEKVIASIMVNLKATPKQLTNRKKNSRIKNISQRLQGKEGRFRQNLLGKRVNFSARTVISPDPNIALTEVGIPQKIAKNLTYPEKVTPLNFNRILNLLVQKKVKYLITRPEVGLGNEEKILNVNKIDVTTKEQFKHYLNYGMIAERMLENGDYVMLNRQPTLHRMSMMAHKVRILPSQTFRINLSVCNPYNADFDGDEMNIHVPQSYQAVAELKTVAAVQGQIVGPKNGTTSMGFSQDSLLGAYLMTSRDTFLTREDFMNLVAKLNQNQLKEEFCFDSLPLPAIMKPEPLWTGKQFVSLFLPERVDLRRIDHASQGLGLRNIGDLSLVIRKGQLLAGILQKEHIGFSSSTSNIIHFIWTEIGADKAEQFINGLQQAAYCWLMATGFSIGAADVVPESTISNKKRSEFRELQNLYYSLFNSFRDKKEVQRSHYHQQGQSIFDSLQYLINLKLNNHLSKIQEDVKQSLISRQNNNIYKIVQIKSKGSETNLAQILYSVGNQNINGKRCPVGFSKRSLPHYCKSDNSPSARGYVLSSYYEGLNPQQFFFHSMGGREGLSDTAVKTSTVGYIERKLVKSLEDLIIKYDGSVRDSRQNLLQHLYGEDGFSPQLIQKHHFSAGESSTKVFREKYKWKEEQLKKSFRYNNSQLEALKKQYLCLQRNRKMFIRCFSDNSLCKNYTYFCPITVDKIINRIKFERNANPVASDPFQIYKSVEQLLTDINVLPRKFRKLHKASHSQNKVSPEQESFSDEFQREDLNKNKQMTANYLNAGRIKIQPDQQFQIFQLHLRFSLSSKLLYKVHGLSLEELTKLLRQIKQRFFKSLVPAGESVGCLASQSIGQPTTQMTLNTFHLAGISDRNVTLGLPRLQQILNCSTSLENSTLTIFPRRPVLETESKDPQNQQYLLNLLFGTLPQVRIGNFIDSSHFNYNPVRKSCTVKMPKQSRGSWTITLIFRHSQIHTHQMWERILNTVRTQIEKNFEVDDVVDYNENMENPKIVLRYLQSVEQEMKGKNLIHYLEQIEARVKSARLGGIVGLRGVRLTKKWVNLDKENGWRQYIAFEGAGKSLKDCLRHDEINSCRTYSDNAHQTWSVLGIEAARSTIFQQLKEVLKPYGISINYKHLSILVDWMCVQGSLTPVNRNGLHRSRNLSTFTKASFERTVDVLFNAAAFSQKNAILNTSQKIIFGRVVECGTSQCELMVDPDKSALFATKQQQSLCKIPSEGGILNAKTPFYQDSPTFQHSLFTVKSSHVGSYHCLTPVSPMIGFSPLHSPNTHKPGMSSPTYRYNVPTMQANRIQYSGRYNTPNYGRYSGSPSYADFLLKTKPAEAERNSGGVLQSQKTDGRGPSRQNT